MNHRTGIVFDYQGSHYRLVDVEWGNDNSFYFLPHQHDAEVGQRIKTERDSVGRLVLHIDEIQAGCFPTKKISRHPSGYLHVKDVVGRGGNRERDGLIGPAFKDVQFFVFLVACPQAIDALVRIEKPEPTDIIVHLPAAIEPFTVQFAVWDKRQTVRVHTRPGELLGNGAITVQSDNLDYGLAIMLLNVAKTSPDISMRFPARTWYLIQ